MDLCQSVSLLKEIEVTPVSSYGFDETWVGERVLE